MGILRRCPLSPPRRRRLSSPGLCLGGRVQRSREKHSLAFSLEFWPPRAPVWSILETGVLHPWRGGHGSSKGHENLLDPVGRGAVTRGAGPRTWAAPTGAFLGVLGLLMLLSFSREKCKIFIYSDLSVFSFTTWVLSPV